LPVPENATGASEKLAVPLTLWTAATGGTGLYRTGLNSLNQTGPGWTCGRSGEVWLPCAEKASGARLKEPVLLTDPEGGGPGSRTNGRGFCHAGLNKSNQVAPGAICGTSGEDCEPFAANASGARVKLPVALMLCTAGGTGRVLHWNPCLNLLSHSGLGLICGWSGEV